MNDDKMVKFFSYFCLCAAIVFLIAGVSGYSENWKIAKCQAEFNTSDYKFVANQLHCRSAENAYQKVRF